MWNQTKSIVSMPDLMQWMMHKIMQVLFKATSIIKKYMTLLTFTAGVVFFASVFQWTDIPHFILRIFSFSLKEWSVRTHSSTVVELLLRLNLFIFRPHLPEFSTQTLVTHWREIDEDFREIQTQCLAAEALDIVLDLFGDWFVSLLESITSTNRKYNTKMTPSSVTLF